MPNKRRKPTNSRYPLDNCVGGGATVVRGRWDTTEVLLRGDEQNDDDAGWVVGCGERLLLSDAL